ncbi:MAG: response regulator transcription factor [Pyrinomonadaceae bacterium]
MQRSDLLTILYADSDEASREFVTNWLRVNARSYLLTHAANGTEVLTRLKKNLFDLYLFDYCLVDMTGPELCRYVRAIDAKSPVLICSPFDRGIDRRMAMAAKATEFIVKPEGFERLANIMDSLLHNMPKPHRRNGHISSQRRSAAII